MPNDWDGALPLPLCLVAPRDQDPLILPDVLDYLRVRRIVGSAYSPDEVQETGLVRIVLAIDEEHRLLLSELDGSVRPGDHFKPVLQGMARSLGCYLQIGGEIVLGPDGEPCPHPDELIAGGDSVRVAYTWQSGSRLVADAVAGSLQQELTGWIGDGWTVIAPAHGHPAGFKSSPLPKRFHPFVTLTRTASTRVVIYSVDGRAKRLPVAMVWQPAPLPVLEDIPADSDAHTVGTVVCAPAMGRDDFAGRGLTEEAIGMLLEATKMEDGEAFFGEAARLLGFPAEAGVLVDATVADPTPATLGETFTVVPPPPQPQRRSPMSRWFGR